MELPAGVKVASGLLVAHSRLAPTAGTTASEVIRWQSLGANLVVGIHGYTRESDGWTSVDGQDQNWALDLDADQTAIDFSRATTLYQGHHEVQVATAVGFHVIDDAFGQHEFFHDGPILTVRNVVHIVQNTVTAPSSSLSLLYAIYEATDNAFLRIAAVTLSRGV